MFASTTSSPLVCLGWTLIHALWQGALVWATYHLVRATIRDAAIRVHLGHVALAVFVVAQCLTFAHLMQATTSSNASIADMTFERLAESESTARRLPLPQLGPAIRVGAWIAAREPYMPLLARLWGIGIALQIVWNLGAYVLLQRHLNACRVLDHAIRERFDALAVRMGLRQAVRFLESTLISTPATARWLKPVVLVPAAAIVQMPVNLLDALILHELAHIRRWDYATNILRTFVSALYFFHPFIRDICGRTADDAELATDAFASRVFGDDKAYAEALVTLAELRRLQPMLLGAGGGDLRGRILRMLRERSLPAATVRSRASLGGSLLSGAVGLLVLLNATGWASNGRATMNRLTHKSFEEVIVESLSPRVPNESFIPSLTHAIDELNSTRAMTHETAVELTDALLDGVDPEILYRRICAVPGYVDFESIRDVPFDSFGDSGDRQGVVDELKRHVDIEPDTEKSARLARGTLVLASLMVPADSGRVATLLLRDPEFIRELRLSQDSYRLFQLMSAVNNDRLSRIGRILAADRRNAGGAADAQIEEFAAELPYLPALQVTMCSRKMSFRFQSRVLAVLRRDQGRYPPGTVKFALEHAARDEPTAH